MSVDICFSSSLRCLSECRIRCVRPCELCSCLCIKNGTQLIYIYIYIYTYQCVLQCRAVPSSFACFASITVFLMMINIGESGNCMTARLTRAWVPLLDVTC